MIPPTDQQLLNGDFFQDGQINILDVVWLIELILND